jgi:hypothetical protein
MDVDKQQSVGFWGVADLSTARSWYFSTLAEMISLQTVLGLHVLLTSPRHCAMRFRHTGWEYHRPVRHTKSLLLEVEKIKLELMIERLKDIQP